MLIGGLKLQVEDIFAVNGPIAMAHPTFEARKGQVAMANAVKNALISKRHLVVQAGTGLGKTFAYLVPSIVCALSEKKRIVVSTKTISLQEQIIKKDIPFLQKALGSRYPFVAVLAKGRGNFLCRRKMDYLQSYDRGLFTERQMVDDVRELQKLVQSNKLAVGDREELTFHPSGELWQQVCGEGDSCLRRACPYFDICYYYSSRRAQIKADIVVVNHALYFADLAVRKEADFEQEQAVLEDYDAVIFDEAHNLEDVATDFFSRRVSAVRIRLTTSALMASFRVGGILAGFEGAESVRMLDTLVTRLNTEASFFFGQFTEGKRMSESDQYANILREPLSLVARAITDLQGGGNSEEQDAYLTLLYERINRIADDLTFILERQGGTEEFAYWIELEDREPSLVSSPVSMEEELRENIFKRIESVVLTSATLSSVLLRRVGLERCDLLRLDSPFDYQSNALLYLPKDALDPRDAAFDDYTAAKVREMVYVTGGRALVLFTSYKSMNAVYDKLAPLSGEGYTLLKQGAGSRSDIMRSFVTGERSVLLAVASYWEGIDVPGEALSCVILVKLPFSVPTEPIMQARFEHMERKGEDAFRTYSLPQAVLKLKQGFGRLIRTATDRGVVAILDHRVQSKFYGKAFIKDLPPARITYDLEDVRKLLASPR